MNQCQECGIEIPENRTHCRACLRAKVWASTSPKVMDELFPPRISRVLKEMGGVIELTTDATKPGLYLYGPAGTGKTIYAAALLMEMKKRTWFALNGTYIQGKFVHTLTLLDEIRSCYSQEKDAALLVKQYSEADVLVLDDLGVERETEWVLQTLYLIINNRYENMLPTIITSNLSLDNLRDRLQDERITSRICEMCRVKAFDGEDYRVKGAFNGI